MTLLLCSYLTAGQKGAVPAGHQQFATPSIVACCWWFGCLLSWVEIYRVIANPNGFVGGYASR